jgi:hypothetical protein
MHQLVVSCADNIAPVIQPEKKESGCAHLNRLCIFFSYTPMQSLYGCRMLLQQRFQFELIKPGLTLRLIIQNGFDKITTESAANRALWGQGNPDMGKALLMDQSGGADSRSCYTEM